MYACRVCLAVAYIECTQTTHSDIVLSDDAMKHSHGYLYGADRESDHKVANSYYRDAFPDFSSANALSDVSISLEQGRVNTAKTDQNAHSTMSISMPTNTGDESLFDLKTATRAMRPRVKKANGFGRKAHAIPGSAPSPRELTMTSNISITGEAAPISLPRGRSHAKSDAHVAESVASDEPTGKPAKSFPNYHSHQMPRIRSHAKVTAQTKESMANNERAQSNLGTKSSRFSKPRSPPKMQSPKASPTTEVTPGRGYTSADFTHQQTNATTTGNQTQQTFILPGLTNTDDLVAGLRKQVVSGLPKEFLRPHKDSSHAKAQSRFTTASTNETTVLQYDRVGGTEIPQEDRDLLGALQRMKVKVAQLEEQKEKLAQHFYDPQVDRDLPGAVRRMKVKIARLEKESSEFEAERYEFHGKVKTLENRLVMEQHMRRPDSGLGSDEDEGEKDKLRAEHSRLKSKVKTLEASCKESDRRVEVSAIHIQNLTKERDFLDEKLDTAEEENLADIEYWRKLYIDQKNDADDFERKYNGLQRENDGLKQDIKDLRESNQSLQEQNDALEDANAAANLDNSQAEQLANERDQLVSEKAELEGENVNLRNQLAQLNTEKQTWNKRETELRKRVPRRDTSNDLRDRTNDSLLLDRATSLRVSSRFGIPLGQLTKNIMTSQIEAEVLKSQPEPAREPSPPVSAQQSGSSSRRTKSDRNPSANNDRDISWHTDKIIGGTRACSQATQPSRVASQAVQQPAPGMEANLTELTLLSSDALADLRKKLESERSLSNQSRLSSAPTGVKDTVSTEDDSAFDDLLASFPAPGQGQEKDQENGDMFDLQKTVTTEKPEERMISVVKNVAFRSPRSSDEISYSEPRESPEISVAATAPALQSGANRVTSYDSAEIDAMLDEARAFSTGTEATEDREISLNITNLSVCSDDFQDTAFDAAENPIADQVAIIRQEERKIEALNLKLANYTGRWILIRPTQQRKKHAAIGLRIESLKAEIEERCKTVTTLNKVLEAMRDASGSDASSGASLTGRVYRHRHR